LQIGWSINDAGTSREPSDGTRQLVELLTSVKIFAHPRRATSPEETHDAKIYVTKCRNVNYS